MEEILAQPLSKLSFGAEWDFSFFLEQILSRQEQDSVKPMDYFL